jgi:hypothetical protein
MTVTWPDYEQQEDFEYKPIDTFELQVKEEGGYWTNFG